MLELLGVIALIAVIGSLGVPVLMLALARIGYFPPVVIPTFGKIWESAPIQQAHTVPLEAAAQAMREAMRETVKRHSLWYLAQGGLMILAGILALVYPVASSFAAVFLLGCVLIASGIVQGISLIDAREVPHFWLQLVSVV